MSDKDSWTSGPGSGKRIALMVVSALLGLSALWSMSTGGLGIVVGMLYLAAAGCGAMAAVKMNAQLAGIFCIIVGLDIILTVVFYLNFVSNCDKHNPPFPIPGPDPVAECKKAALTWLIVNLVLMLPVEFLGLSVRKDLSYHIAMSDGYTPQV